MGNLRNSFALVSVVALCGCQFLGNLHFAQKAPAAPPAAATAGTAYGSASQAGREHLRGNRTGLAIEAFNRALASGEEPALAYNGLGVAYARLGRSDLAYRFFKKAMMSDPTNPMFAHNLASLINSPAFTLDQMAGSSPALAVSLTRSADLGTAAAPALRASGRLYRDSNRQFSLVTAAPEPARAAPGRGSAARDDCARPGPVRNKRFCQTTRLPAVQSRTRQPALTAFNEAFPTSQVPTAALADQPVSAPKGKRKTVDLRSLQQTTPQQPVSQQRRLTTSNAAT